MQDETGTSLTSDPIDSRPAPAPAPSRSRLSVVVAMTTLLTLLADQGSKIWALGALEPGRPEPLIGEWIRFNLIWNSGAAFSLGSQATWVLTIISIAITIAVLVAVRRVTTTGWALTFGLLLGGAIGNLIDRIFREPGWFRGHVVDFIDYFGWFVGNVADIAIVVAAAIVVILTLRGIPPTHPRPAKGEPDA